MKNRIIYFNMEKRCLKEWANKLKISESTLRRRLNKGETLFDIVRNPSKYNRYKNTICNATNWKDCFNCQFKDCIRNNALDGESEIVSRAFTAVKH